jgi:hypothetical protein
MTKARENSDYTGLQAEIAAGDTAARAGRKNLIINGGMQVAQRGTSATGLGASSGYFTLDRYNAISSTTGRFTMSQSTDAPIGFAKSMKVDCTTADTSIGANEYAIFTQAVEAQDIQDMARGTSGAKEVTVSFYVKGNASTTYVCELQDEAGRELSKTFNVTTAWERVELTFPADTNVAAANTYDNTAGIYLYIWIQAGSNFSSGTTPTTWADQSNANRCAGIGNFFSSTSNELYITGIQMEVGSVATDFEHRSYGEELSLCQRYFERFDYGGGGRSGLTGQCHTTSVMYGGFHFQPKRATPSISTSTVSNFRILHAGAATNVTGLAFNANTMCARVGVSTGGGLTAGRAGCMDTANDNGQYIDIDAEL